MIETQTNNMTDSPQIGRIQFSQKDYSDMSKAVEVALDQSIEANAKMGQYRDYDEMSMTDCEGKKVTIQYPWDTDIYGTMKIVMRLLIANGFSPDTVKNGFSYMWNEFYDIADTTPDGLCYSCGTKNGADVDEGCTWWIGRCTSCRKKREVTDESDYR